MKEKIENRLKELRDEYAHLTNGSWFWIQETGGLTRRQRIEKCKILTEELEALLNK